MRRKMILTPSIIAQAMCSTVKKLSAIIAYSILVTTFVSLFMFPLMKVSAESSVMWYKTYGETFEDTASSLVQTSDGGYALAGYASLYEAGAGTDALLVKTDANGNMEWSQTYGGTGDDAADSVVQTSDGGYALAGDTTSFGAGGYDFWLVKTDASGNMIWQKTYGGTEFDRGPSLVVTSDGGYALAGYAGHTGPFSVGSGDFWLVKTDASGNMMWNQTYGGTNFDAACSLVVTSDGGYAIAGFTSSFGAGDNDFWLVKTDASGNMIWSQTYGGTEDDRAYSLVVTSDGGYTLVGYTNSFGAGSSDWWLVKTDASGNMIWSQTYGGTEDDYAFSLVATSDGGYTLVGETRSFKAEGSDWWLVKTDSSGNMIWSQTYLETNYGGRVYSVIVTSDGNYAIAGSTSSTGENVDFGLAKIEAQDGTEPPPALALPMEYIYVVSAAVIIVVLVIGVIAYRKRK